MQKQYTWEIKMNGPESEGRLKQLLRLQKKLMWYKIGQCVLGILAVIAVLGITFLLFFTEG